MILTEKLLKENNACKEGIDFCKRNKLFGFDLARLDEVHGEHHGFIYWLTHNILLFDLEYDDRDRLIKKGSMTTYDYDGYDNLIQKTFSSGVIITFEYNERNNCICEYNSDGCLWIYEYDEHDRLITKTHKNTYNGEQHSIIYVYDTRGNRIKEMRGDNAYHTIYEYDNNNNMVMKTYDGLFTTEYTYDNNGNIIQEHKQIPLNTVETHTIQYYPNGQLKRYDALYIPLI
jgi:YD repeat-containing protein